VELANLGPETTQEDAERVLEPVPLRGEPAEEHDLLARRVIRHRRRLASRRRAPDLNAGNSKWPAPAVPGQTGAREPAEQAAATTTTTDTAMRRAAMTPSCLAAATADTEPADLCCTDDSHRLTGRRAESALGARSDQPAPIALGDRRPGACVRFVLY